MQSFYVDQRPLNLKYLGLLVCVLSLIGLLLSFFWSAAELFAEVDRQFRATHGRGMNVGFYVVNCVRNAKCIDAYMGTWDVPLWLKVLLVSGAWFGFASYLCGRFWRPELVAMRNIRLNATQVVQNVVKSPADPGRFVR